MFTFKYNIKLIFILFLLMFSSFSSAVQIQPPDNNGQLPPYCQELINKANASTNGEIEILIVLNVEFSPEAAVDKKLEVIQRERISQAKTNFENKLTELSGQAQILKKFSDIIPVVLIKADATAISELCEDSSIKSMEENKENEPTLLDSVPLINADYVANAGYTGDGWVVAILDTGVQKSHTFLSGKVVYEACYSKNSPPTLETLCPNGMESQEGPGAATPCEIGGCYHGTHVAGIAAGRDDSYNSNGIYGVAPDAKIIAIQVFSKKNEDCGSQIPPCLRTYDDDLIDGLTKVFDLRNTYNIASVNMSLGGGKYGSYCDGSALKTIIDLLKASGIAVVVSAGNKYYCDGISHPACISSTIAVGSTTKDDKKSNFSNYDPDFENFIFAPGSNILSSISSLIGSLYSTKSGTSMAAPHVAGAFAVIRQYLGSTPTVDDILNSLQTTGVAISGFCGGATEPRIDLLATLQDFNDSPSVTNFTAMPTTGYAPLTVNFSCSGTDSDGSIVSYEWNFGDGTTQMTNIGSTNHTYNDKGIFNATCTVIDDLGETDESTSIAINVKLHYELNVTKAGSGLGKVNSSPLGINCGADCSEFYDENTDVTLTANPDPDNAFVEWNGDCDSCGSNLNCTVTMDSNKSCEAVFEPLYTLTITKSGTGSGTVSSNPSGINCGGTCSADFVNGTSVTLTASVSGSNGFFGWTGDCAACGNNENCIIDMASDKNCDVEFNKTTKNGKMYGNYTLGDWPNVAFVNSQITCSNTSGAYTFFSINFMNNGQFKSVFAYSKNSVTCYDDPAFDSMKPNVEFDTTIATLEGKMNYYTPVIIEIEESDNGEPGTGRDYVHIKIKNKNTNAVIFEINGMVTSGSVYAMPLY